MFSLFRIGESIMRGLKRQKQTVYWSKITEALDGIDTVPSYSQPQSFKFSVSSTAGTPEEISAGIVPDYDRYITSFNRSFHPQEGDVFWIDTVPQVDTLGNLVLEDGIPATPPDYRLKKVLDTQRGNVADMESRR